jgi:hypothetical protein
MENKDIYSIIAGTFNDVAASFGVNTGQWLSRIINKELGSDVQKYWTNKLTPAGLSAMINPPIDSKTGKLNLPGIAMNYLIDPVNMIAPELKYASFARGAELTPAVAEAMMRAGVSKLPRSTKLLKAPGFISDVVEASNDQLHK